jgi:hypothetical protein
VGNGLKRYSLLADRNTDVRPGRGPWTCSIVAEAERWAFFYVYCLYEICGQFPLSRWHFCEVSQLRAHCRRFTRLGHRCQHSDVQLRRCGATPSHARSGLREDCRGRVDLARHPGVRLSYPDYVDLRDHTKTLQSLACDDFFFAGIAPQVNQVPKYSLNASVSGNFFSGLRSPASARTRVSHRRRHRCGPGSGGGHQLSHVEPRTRSRPFGPRKKVSRERFRLHDHRRRAGELHRAASTRESRHSHTDACVPAGFPGASADFAAQLHNARTGRVRVHLPWSIPARVSCIRDWIGFSNALESWSYRCDIVFSPRCV